MRDIVPRKQPDARAFVTPWSTYVSASTAGPIKTPTKQLLKNRTSVSPSPVAHSKEQTPPSPFIFSPVAEDGRSTPSITECPHESMQLPKRTLDPIRREPSVKKSPIDVIEEFIANLSVAEKEAVRATYNGVDWHRPNKRVTPHAPPPSTNSSFIQAPVVNRRTTMVLPNHSYLMPSYVPNYGVPFQQNRFLASLPVSIAPQIIYPPTVYFPRGC